MRKKLIDSVFNKYTNTILEYNNASSIKIVNSDGDLYSKIALVGEAPGSEEVKLGKPFVGAAGKNLNFFLKFLNITRESIYLTNVVKFRPTQISAKTGKLINRTPKKAEIELSSTYLIEELSIINPDIVVTLGNIPLRAVLDDFTALIGKLHGQILETKIFKVFPLYHPASVIYNRSLFEVYEKDLIRLKELI